MHVSRPTGISKTEDLYTIVRSLAQSRFGAVFGTRAIKVRDLSEQLKTIYANKRGLYLTSKYGGILLSIVTLLLYNRYITDVLTSIKAFDAQLLRKLQLQSSGRDLDAEICAKLALLHEYILELPVDYSPRTRSEGKKITMMDGIQALTSLFRYRLFPGLSKPSFSSDSSVVEKSQAAEAGRKLQTMALLSIVIPAYNEAEFIGTLLNRIFDVPTESLGFQKEIIVVDDGSKDRTAEIARGFPGVRVFTQVPNQGKGKAVQRGIQESTGDYVLVQDADLEYDPGDYLILLRALDPKVDSVYGSRVLGQRRKQGSRCFRAAPRTAFRAMARRAAFDSVDMDALRQLDHRYVDSLQTLSGRDSTPMKIRTSGFETDHEITAKLIRGGQRIIEVPIAYMPRSIEAGKKIKPRDGFIAVWTLLKFRFLD